MTYISQFTDDELIEGYEELRNAHRIELSMDGSGELGWIIDEHFNDLYEAFEEEAESRNISLTNPEVK